MWILVASAFRSSGEPDQEDLRGRLEAELRDHGHEVDSIRIPFDPNPDALWEQLFAFRMTNVRDVGELLLATGTPCHLLRHRRKLLWLTDHYPSLEDGSEVLASLALADRQACAEATATFAASDRVRDRIARSSGTVPGLLAPPPEGSWEHVVEALTGTGRAAGGR